MKSKESKKLKIFNKVNGTMAVNTTINGYSINSQGSYVE